MTDPFAGIAAGLAPAGWLEPDAIGAAQDTVIGMANAAPAVSMGLTLAALAAATAYAGGPVIVVTALPMLVIANAYRRLNMWNANCGASFEWVGRAINPYLGFLTGWLMITGRGIESITDALNSPHRPGIGPAGYAVPGPVPGSGPVPPPGAGPVPPPGPGSIPPSGPVPPAAGAAHRGGAVSRFVTTGCDAARLLRVWTM